MKLIKGVLINLKTNEEVLELLLECEQQGIKWASGRNALEFNPYQYYGDKTCIVIYDDVITYDSLDSHKSFSSKFNVVTIKQLKEE